MKLLIIAYTICIGQIGGHLINHLPTMPDQNIKLEIMKTTSKESITAVIHQYFKGIETGDTTLLGNTFHKDALLFGDINGTPYAKTRNDYLSGVATRISPEKSGQPFESEILFIEVINSIAIVKLHVRMYAFNYYNFLTLHKTNNNWLIVNKTLTNVID